MKKIFTLSAIMVALLCACTNKGNSIIDSLNSSDDSSIDTSNETSGTSDGTSEYVEKEELETNLKGSEWFKYYGEREGCRSLPSKGERNVLVVPMQFSDEKKPMSKYNISVIKDINAVYNGKAGETSFVSVKEYYEKASYGQLKLNIDVVQEWCKLDKTLQELYDMGKSEMADQSWYAIDYVTKWYQEKFGDIKKYDTDNDGYIDSVIVIFSHDAYTKKVWPYFDGLPTEAEKALSWAFTFWTYEEEANMEVPETSAYNWISYGYMDEGKTNKPDPHTYIHEFGHLLGLTDYYSYDYLEDGGRYAPAGKVNMQDYNVGDQDSYSKFLLDWTVPNVVTKEEEITINKFESSGDCILVPASTDYENSPLDEYLLIDLYSPTGLNECDSKNSSEPRTFSEVGIKIYHVDSRLAKIDWDDENEISTFVEWADKPTYDYLTANGQKPYYYDIAASNTESYCLNSTDYKRLNLLSSNEGSVNNHYYLDRGATNDDLYHEGDVIETFSFNNGNSLCYKIEIKSIIDGKATIGFIKNK